MLHYNKLTFTGLEKNKNSIEKLYITYSQKINIYGKISIN